MTGMGKGDPIKLGKRLLFGVDPDLVGESKIVSGAALRLSLSENPVRCYFLDEVQDQMNLVTNKANPHVSDVLGELKMRYNAFDQDSTEVTVKREKSKKIISPAITLVMTGTAESFYEMIKKGEYSGGFMNRLTVLPVEDDLSKEENDDANKDDLSEPTELVERLKALLPSGFKELMEMPMEAIKMPEDGETRVPKGAQMPVVYSIDWESDTVFTRYKRLRDEMNKERDSIDFNRRHLCQRVAENAIRMATIVAVGRKGVKVVGDKVIASTVTMADMELGEALARLSFRTACAQSEKHNAIKFNLPDMCEEVMAFIMSEGKYDGKPKIVGEATQSMLSRCFRKNLTNKYSLPDALAHLQSEGRIDDEWRKTGGVRSTQVWKAQPSEFSGKSQNSGENAA
jgi:hypothetical protein